MIQSPMMTPMSPFVMSGSPMGSGAMAPKPPVNPTDLAMKKAGNALGDTIAQQLSEAAQMGVPYEHLLAQLAKLSGNPSVGAGQQSGEGAYGVMNRGGMPPTGGNQPGGQPPQPPPPPPPSGMGVPQQQPTDPNQVSSNQLTPDQMANSPVGQTQSWSGFQGGVPQQPTMNPWKPMEILPSQSPFGSAKVVNGNMVSSGPFGALLGRSTSGLLNDYGKLAEINTATQTMAGAVPAQEKDRMTLAGTIATNQGTQQNRLREQTNKLSDDFNVAIKDYNDIMPRYETISEFVKNPSKQYDNGFNDLMLINEVLKIVDPGTANREGEVTTWAKADSVLGRSALKFGKGWRTGEKLSEHGRKQILNAMTAKFNTVSNDANRKYSSFSRKARNMGVDPEVAFVFNKMGKAPKEGAQAPGGNLQALLAEKQRRAQQRQGA